MSVIHVEFKKSVLRLTDESGEPGWYHLSIRGKSWALRQIEPGEEFGVVLRRQDDDDVTAALQSLKYTADCQLSIEQARRLARVDKVPNVEDQEDLDNWVFIAGELERRFLAGTLSVAEAGDAQAAVRRVVPTTSLRRLYQWLQKETIGVHAAVARGFLERPEELAGLFARAVKKLKAYENPERILTRRRAPLPPFEGPQLEGTNDLVAVLQAQGGRGTVQSRPELDFTYMEREVSPLRTTNGVYEDGWPASNSGAGGIDLLLLAQDGSVPVVGEIKVATDKNPFFGLVQSLTYAAELATPPQYRRLMSWLAEDYGLPVGSGDRQPCLDIYLILADYPEDREPYGQLLETTRGIVEGLFKQAGSPPLAGVIRRIACLDARLEAAHLDFGCRFAFGV